MSDSVSSDIPFFDQEVLKNFLYCLLAIKKNSIKKFKLRRKTEIMS